MEDICHLYFVSCMCPEAACGRAHNLRQLANLDRWVVLPKVNAVPAYITKTGEVDRSILAEQCTLLRCRSPAHAQAVVQAHRQCSALADCLAEATGLPLTTDAAASSSISHLTSPPLPTPPPCATVADDSRVLLQLDGLGSDFQELRELQPPESVVSHSVAGLPTPSPPSPSASSPLHPPSPPIPAATQERPTKVWGKKEDKIRSDNLLRWLRHQPFLSAGWEAVDLLLGIRQEQLAPDVLSELELLPLNFREQVLLSLAANGLHAAQEGPSGRLQSIIQEHRTSAQSQVCLYFLVDGCRTPHCPFLHPHNTSGWNRLEEMWSKTFHDFDYQALSSLAKKEPKQQEDILGQLAADQHLDEVQNLSAKLNVLIYKTQKHKKPSQKAPAATGSVPSQRAGQAPMRHPCPKLASRLGLNHLHSAAGANPHPLPAVHPPAQIQDLPLTFMFKQQGAPLIAWHLFTLPAVRTADIGLSAVDVATLAGLGLPMQPSLLTWPSNPSMSSSSVSVPSIAPLLAARLASGSLPAAALPVPPGAGPLPIPISRPPLMSPHDGYVNRFPRPR